MEMVRSWKTAVESFLNAKFAPGHVVPRAWFVKEFGLREPQTLEESKRFMFDFMADMDHFRDWLLIEHKVHFQTIRGEGYRVVPPAEQADVAVRLYTAKIGKALEGMGKHLTHIDLSSLTDTERAAATMQQGKYVQLAMMMGHKPVRMSIK